MPAKTRSFDEDFALLFKEQYGRIYRYLDRMSNDPDAAEDLAQETFVRLYRRGSMPDQPSAWLVSVGMNLLRNLASSTRRRSEILVANPGGHGHSAAVESTDAGALASETHARVRWTVDALTDREKDLLLLRAEGYSYRELAIALELNEASVGTLLARAQRSFRARYEESGDAR
ncbi:MAG: sigma-70 family RNA polymerase sigma factor [Gemmatimonadaceae bacterium]